MLRKALLTIIIPTYNCEDSIASAIKSCMDQTFTDFELIIVDGVSNDKTLDIIANYSANDERIKVFSERDEGVYDAMNKGMSMSGGEWIYFLGADDRLHNKYVLEQIFCNQEDIDSYNVLYGNVEIVGNVIWANNGDIYDGKFSFEKLLHKNICHQGIFYRRSYITLIGKYNTNYIICADWDFNLRCWSCTEFMFIDIIVAYFYAGGESTKSQSDQKFSADFIVNLLTYFEMSPFDPTLKNLPSYFFNDVVFLQKKESYCKYLINKIKNKLA